MDADLAESYEKNNLSGLRVKLLLWRKSNKKRGQAALGLKT